MKLLVIDDHPLLLDAFRSLLKNCQHITMFTARSLTQARDVWAEVGPVDLTILDYHLPDVDGLDGLRSMLNLRGRNRVAMITAQASWDMAVKAIECGAVGYLPKSLPASSVLNAIEFMHRGEIFVPLRSSFPKDAQPKFAPQINAREETILAQLTQGATNDEIAENLGRSEVSVKQYLTVLFQKIGARNRTHAAAIASKFGY